ncbi:ABC transporter substrate-binding protein [Thioalkalivibrio sulfidiphilus]|uniref:ABC transporter substrate-binding protein n=1 Tax=Thioalkalivibrio sulfidiphilus TaxID=1033854 RepID=UPI003B387CBF
MRAATLLPLFLFALLGPVPVQAEKLERLVLTGPPAAVSFPLVHMVVTGALEDLAHEVRFTHWRDPDQLRVMALGGQAQVLAMPTNVAANLYNRGAALRLLNVSTWGVLWLVSRDPDLRTLADLHGKEIAMPFRADMPDILFGTLARAQGLDPRRDFRLRYVGSPLDAMQLLVMRRVDHALLAEPAVSMALRRTQSFPVSLVAPDLYRSVDLQQEWGRVFEREARIPQAGIVVMGEVRANPALLERVQAAYSDSLRWCRDNPLPCGEIVAGQLDMLTPEAVADAIAVSQLEAVPAPAARPALEFFYQRLLEETPALVGGRLPDDAFFGMGAP